MTGPAQDVAAMVAGRPALLQEACRRALAYLDGLADRPVAPDAAAVAALDRLDFPLPGTGLAGAEVLRMLDEAGSPATVASAGPRYFGFVTGGTLPVAQAAAWLSAAWDQNAATTVMSPAAAHRGGRRRGACNRAQGARPGRPRPRPGSGAGGRRPGPDRSR